MMNQMKPVMKVNTDMAVRTGALEMMLEVVSHGELLRVSVLGVVVDVAAMMDEE
jgi:hypothetical protein